MNERIRELAEQASHQSPDGYPVTIPYSKDFAKKFADLIAQECIQYLANEAERLYALRNDDGDLLAEKCYDNIQGLKEHFGIE